jgi:hypothetical protein
MSIPEDLRRDPSGIQTLEAQGFLHINLMNPGKLAHWQAQDIQAAAEHV